MREPETRDFARQLWETHGPAAIAQAAQRASDLERQGKTAEADLWRRIEAILFEMRGPRQS